MLKFEKTGDTQSKKLNLLCYGPPGSGKTRFAGTSKKRFHPLILSAESGLLSLQQIKDETGKPYVFDYIKITDWSQIEEIRNEARHGKLPFDTIIMDSITEIQQVCMDKILQQEKLEKARIQDWGTLAQRMITTIRDFRDMDKNFVVTALADTVTDEETGSSRVIPMVQGQLKEKLAAYFDEVFYLLSKTTKDPKTGKEEVKRSLITQGTQKLTAKDRSGELPAMVDPDFCVVYDLIFKKPKENTT